MSETFSELQRKQWLERRRRGLGSSDSAAILGHCPHNRTALDVYASKVCEPKDDTKAEHLRMGHLMEPVIAKLFAEQTSREVIDPGLRIDQHEYYHWFLASVDYWQRRPDRPNNGILEIKNVGVQYAGNWREDLPIHVQIQVQHQFAVTGAKWGSVAALIGGNKFVWVDVEPDKKFQRYLIRQLLKFWHQVVERIEPQADQHSKESLTWLHPKDNGETIALPEDATDWTDELAEIADKSKALAARKEELENRIRQAIGDATFGAIPGDDTHVWKWAEQTAYHKAKAAKTVTSRVLRRVKR